MGERGFSKAKHLSSLHTSSFITCQPLSRSTQAGNTLGGISPFCRTSEADAAECFGDGCWATVDRISPSHAALQTRWESCCISVMTQADSSQGLGRRGFLVPSIPPGVTGLLREEENQLCRCLRWSILSTGRGHLCSHSTVLQQHHQKS